MLSCFAPFCCFFFFFSQSSCESRADDLRCGVTLKQQLSGSVARVKHLKPEHELGRGRQLMRGGGVGGGVSEWRAAGQFTLAYKFRFFLFFSCQKNRVDSSECRSSEHIFFFWVQQAVNCSAGASARRRRENCFPVNMKCPRASSNLILDHCLSTAAAYSCAPLNETNEIH